MKQKGINCSAFKIHFDISDTFTLIDDLSKQAMEKQDDIALKLARLYELIAGIGDGGTIKVNDLLKIANSCFELEITAGLIKENPAMSKSYVGSIIGQLKSFKEFLSKNNVEIINHNGQRYDSNMKLDVIEFVNTEEEHPKIIETIEPSVKLEGKLIKQGKVIVAQNKNK